MLTYPSWNLGTCVPEGVLRHLSNTQPNIKNLSIITDVSCSYNRHIGNLSRFTTLQKLTWIKLDDVANDTVWDVLESSASFLEEIEINSFCPSGEEFLRSTAKKVLAHPRISLVPGEQSTLFHSLRKLVLSGLWLLDATTEIISAFNFAQLRSLKLRDCLGTNQLLNMLAGISPPVRLTSFELNYTHYNNEIDDSYREITHVARFLKSFTGLIKLYILCPDDGEIASDFWRSVHHHKSTLEKVVYQGNREYLDLDFWVKEQMPEALFYAPRMEYLGLCFWPEQLVGNSRDTRYYLYTLTCQSSNTRC